jgi:YbbR domain-containing protein
LLTKVLVSVITAVSVTTAGAAAVNANVKSDTNVAVTSSGYSKDQCKDGGWRELGFKNQGDCISSFVSNGVGN